MDELYACPVGVALWERYRRGNPHAPEVPPDGMEMGVEANKAPAATAYWAHASECEDCNEV